MTELFGLGLFGLGLGLFGSVFGLRLIMPRVNVNYHSRGGHAGKVHDEMSLQVAAADCQTKGGLKVAATRKKIKLQQNSMS